LLGAHALFLITILPLRLSEQTLATQAHDAPEFRDRYAIGMEYARFNEEAWLILVTHLGATTDRQ
jgi:hypothetical protein